MRYALALLGLALATAALVIVFLGRPADDGDEGTCIAVDCETGPHPTAPAPPASTVPPQIVNPIGDCTPR